VSDLEGRRVLITGGAGAGIGRAMVELFRAEGAHVIVVDIEPERVRALAGELSDVTTVVADIATEAGADAAIEAAGDRLDVLCNHSSLVRSLM
jgi:NAD(P)-dependent dehydrogenase (short-subunit alcohol dehydrogenase family)